MYTQISAQIQQHEYLFLTTLPIEKSQEGVKSFRNILERLSTNFDLNTFDHSFYQITALIFGDKNNNTKGWLNRLLLASVRDKYQIRKSMFDLLQLLSPTGPWMSLMQKSQVLRLQLEVSMLPAYVASDLKTSPPLSLQKYLDNLIYKDSLLTKNQTIVLNPLQYYLAMFSHALVQSPRTPGIGRPEDEELDEFILHFQNNPYLILARRYLHSYQQNPLLSAKTRFFLKEYILTDYVTPSNLANVPTVLAINLSTKDNNNRNTLTGSPVGKDTIARTLFPKLIHFHCLYLLLLDSVDALSSEQAHNYLEKVMKNRPILVNGVHVADIARVWFLAIGCTTRVENDVLRLLQSNDSKQAKDRLVKIKKYVPETIDEAIGISGFQRQKRGFVCNEIIKLLFTNRAPFSTRHQYVFEISSDVMSRIPAEEFKKHQNYQEAKAQLPQVFMKYQNSLTTEKDNSFIEWINPFNKAISQPPGANHNAQIIKKRIITSYQLSEAQLSPESYKLSGKPGPLDILSSAQAATYNRPRFNEWQAPVRRSESTIMFWIAYGLAKILQVLTLSGVKGHPPVNIRFLAHYFTILQMILLGCILYYWFYA